MKYINQKDDYSCGATAAYNALAWAGQRLRLRRDWQKVQRGTRCTRADGAEVYAIAKYLKRQLKNGCTITRRRYPKLGYIEQHLKNKGAVVLCYKWGNIRWGGTWGHYILIIRKECDMWGNEGYVVVNEGSRTIQTIDRGTLRGYLRKVHATDQFRGYYPDAIFLTKRRQR